MARLVYHDRNLRKRLDEEEYVLLRLDRELPGGARQQASRVELASERLPEGSVGADGSDRYIGRISAIEHVSVLGHFPLENEEEWYRGV